MKYLLKTLLIIVSLLHTQHVLSQWELTYSSNTYGTTGYSHFSFSSPQNGWEAHVHFGSASGNDDLTISNTNDFGVSWSGSYHTFAQSITIGDLITSGNYTIYYFINYSYGGSCQYSYDSGNQWSTINMPGYGTWTMDAFPLSKDTILLTSGLGRLFKFTQDSIYTLLKNDSINFEESRIFFIDSNIGYIKAKDILNNNILLFTDDGGYNFTTSCISVNYQINDIYFTSDSVGYLCCSSGKILKTIDYGVSFIELTTPTTNNLTYLQFINDSCGYCVGDNGTCIYTS